MAGGSPQTPRENGAVLWQSPLDDTRHWGRDLVLALDAAGVPMTTRSLGGPKAPAHLVDPASERRLQELHTRPMAPNPVQIFAGNSADFRREPSAARAIVWTDQDDAAHLLGAGADQLWVPSQYLRDKLVAKGAAVERVVVVPFGVAALNYGTTVHEIPVTGEFHFLLPTDFSVDTPWQTVLATFLRLYGGRKDVYLRLRLVSDEFDPMLRKQITDRHMSDFAIRYADIPLEAFEQVLVDREPHSERERAMIYWGTHACISVPTDRAFNRTALEAQAIGLPVVVAAQGGQADYVDERNGFVVPVRRKGGRSELDVGVLETVMRQLVDQRMTTGARGIVARVGALNGRTWTHTAAQAVERLAALTGVHWQSGSFEPVAESVTAAPDQEPIAAPALIQAATVPELSGVNVIGHISGNLGIGVTARCVVQALLDRGVDVTTIDIDPGMERAGADRRFDRLAVQRYEDLPHAVNLFVLPPASIAAIHQARPDFFQCGHLNVGFSMWELPTVPQEWVPALQALDVLVAESEFIRYGYQFSLSGVQVLSAPHPLYLPDTVRAERARFGLAEDAVVFLSSFEPNSDVERKNPQAVVDAFLRGVGRDERAHLVFKLNNAVYNGAVHPSVRALQAHAEQHPRIHVLTETLSYQDVLNLYASCDVFVSLHRAEGLGLALLECMALGKPVIATGWSGNLSFMDHTCACLVGYELIPVNGTIPAYKAEMTGEARWADPDVDEAAAWMRRLTADARLRSALGTRARNRASQYLARAAQADFIDELARIRDQRDFLAGGAPAIVLPAAITDGGDLYRRWLQQRDLRASELRLLPEIAATWQHEPWFHIVTAVAPGRDPLFADTLDSITAQIYGGWKLTVLACSSAPSAVFAEHPNLEWLQLASLASLAEAYNEVARRSECDWIITLPVGDRLDPRALLWLGDAAEQNQGLQLIYGDEDAVEADGSRARPAFKPDFNVELLRSWPYLGETIAIRRRMFLELGGYQDRAGAEIYDLALRLYEQEGADAFGHVARIVSHACAVERRGDDVAQAIDNGLRVVREHLARVSPAAVAQAGALPGTHRIRYGLERQPLVSVIVPTRNAKTLLAACVDSLHTRTTYRNFELLVVDNNSDDVEAIAYLDSLPSRFENTRILRYAGQYSFSAINNFAARQARGEYLLLLNNDTQVVHENWLEEMVSQALRPDVGVVGARLLFPDGRVQHGGVVLGMGANGVAEHCGTGLAHEDPGYLGRMQVTQEVGAVTGACLLVAKSFYDQLGGLDERHLPVMYNDIDLCLKVREMGAKVIWTPFATLIHHGSASLKDKQYTDNERPAREAEIALMLQRWPQELAADRYYNRNLSLKNGNCECDVEIATGWDPDRALRPRVMGMGFGSEGSWQHRVVLPLTAFEQAAVAEIGLVPKYQDRVRVPSVAELLREKPDTLLLHNAVHDVYLDALPRYRKFTDTFLVFGQDDLMFQLPPSNPFHDQVYKDIKKRLRQAIGLCDRLVVSTEPLADAYRDMASDIVVRPNYLSADIWGRLESRRRRGAKPRVGWAGAQQHIGDLALIVDVVKRTAKEVDWVFFGLCFEELLPYVAEVVNPVVFAEYPRTLASLDLDLAIAPLEHNRFNECKSNLKVLEYGALGIPVVCSDIEPYRNAPVARVQNRTADWLEAIRARLDDLDSAAAEGNRLRQWVHEHWLLESRLDAWLDALSAETRTDALIEASAS